MYLYLRDKINQTLLYGIKKSTILKIHKLQDCYKILLPLEIKVMELQ